jgi:hypothetical protein
LNFDGLSAFWRFLVTSLGTLFPVRLALGVAVGFGAKTGVHVLAETTAEKSWVALDEFSSIWFILILTPWLFVPIIFGRKGAPESAVHHINTVELLIARSGLSPHQRTMIWRSLIEKYLNAVQPDLSRPSPALNALLDDAKKDIDGTPENP